MLFEDTFEVTAVNPDGKKFDKGQRRERITATPKRSSISALRCLAMCAALNVCGCALLRLLHSCFPLQ
jgi:hypothetical protein